MSQQDYTKPGTNKPPPNPWIPVFGFISLLVFGGFSWVVAPQLRPFVEQNVGVRFPAKWPVWYGNALLAFILFIILFSIGMMLVGLLAGQTSDPRDIRTSTKKMQKEMRQKQRERKTRY